ncbi:hypothetical protein Hanom_Chr07g00656771 [Helianthus anomalus]
MFGSSHRHIRRENHKTKILPSSVVSVKPSIISPATISDSDGSAYRQTRPPHPRHNPYSRAFLSR